MADKKISQLTGATTPLAGSEVLPIVQGGSTVKVSVDNLTAGKTVSAAAFNSSAGYQLRGADNTSYEMLRFAGGTNNPGVFARVTESTNLGAIWLSGSNTSGQVLTLGASGITDSFKISATDTTVTYGNLVIGTAAKGIDFSANTGNVLDQYKYADFTPTWGASSVNPAIGNGTIVGSYVRVGKMCMFQFSLTMGSTTTFGTGEWTFTAPFTAAKTGVGSAWALDSGTAFYVGSAKVEAGSNQIYIWSNNTGTAWSSAQPFTWAANDRIEIGISFTV